MTTISFDENITLNKNHFKSLDEFQLYLLEIKQKSDLSPEHEAILDSRLYDADHHPKDFISLNELKSSIQRK